eukprot:SAG22_NODE_340_length_12031_cov_9.961783_7_plen_267_part_00
MLCVSPRLCRSGILVSVPSIARSTDVELVATATLPSSVNISTALPASVWLAGQLAAQAELFDPVCRVDAASTVFRYIEDAAAAPVGKRLAVPEDITVKLVAAVALGTVILVVCCGAYTKELLYPEGMPPEQAGCRNICVRRPGLKGCICTLLQPWAHMAHALGCGRKQGTQRGPHGTGFDGAVEGRVIAATVDDISVDVVSAPSGGGGGGGQRGRAGGRPRPRRVPLPIELEPPPRAGGRDDADGRVTTATDEGGVRGLINDEVRH